jgi:hypothetical protein
MPKGGGNIGEEIEKDLDDVNRSYIKQIDHATPFGTTALLAVRVSRLALLSREVTIDTKLTYCW